MRSQPAQSTDGLAVLAGARDAAGQADGHLPWETMARFNELAGRGALEAVAPAQAWQLIEEAMSAPAPWRFIELLRDCGALAHLLPELDTLFGVPQPAAVHPEICAGVHSLLTLRRAAERTADTAIRFAALLHDIGKAATPRADWPRHEGHHRLGVRAVERIAARLRLPDRFADMALLAVRHHTTAERIETLSPDEASVLFAAVRDPERLDALLLICEADHRGRAGFETARFPQTERLREGFRTWARR